MSIIGLLLFVLVVVVAFWLLGKAPLDPPIKQIVTIILVVVFLVWLLEATGILGWLGLNTPIIRYR